jgi:hypothetical protein
LHIVTAFGDAASTCLEAYVKSTPRLAALIAYYPSRLPDPQQTTYPMHTTVLVHLVGDMIKIIRTPEVLGIQGKKKIIDKRTGSGAGLGGELKLSFQAYKYPGVEEGFAESDLDEYDAAAAGLAWSRSLGVVRKALRIASDIERIRDEQLDRRFHGNPHKYQHYKTDIPRRTKRQHTKSSRPHQRQPSSPPRTFSHRSLPRRRPWRLLLRILPTITNITKLQSPLSHRRNRPRSR